MTLTGFEPVTLWLQIQRATIEHRQQLSEQPNIFTIYHLPYSLILILGEGVN